MTEGHEDDATATGHPGPGLDGGQERDPAPPSPP